MFVCQCRAISCNHIKQTSAAYADDIMSHVEFYKKALEIKDLDPNALITGNPPHKKMICGSCSCDFRRHTDEHNKRAASRETVLQA
jgi:hypothetical protein